MSSVLNTSTMKSPPLEVWVTGSAAGGCVSAARFGCGTTRADSLDGDCCAPVGMAGAAKAAAPVSVTPVRNLRRPATEISQDFFDICSSAAVTGQKIVLWRGWRARLESFEHS